MKRFGSPLAQTQRACLMLNFARKPFVFKQIKTGNHQNWYPCSSLGCSGLRSPSTSEHPTSHTATVSPTSPRTREQPIYQRPSSRRAVKTNHWLSVGVGGFISKRHVITRVEIYVILHIPQKGVLVNVSTVKNLFVAVLYLFLTQNISKSSHGWVFIPRQDNFEWTQ